MSKINCLVLAPPIIDGVSYWRLWEPLAAVDAILVNSPYEIDFRFKRKELDFFDVWNTDVVIVSRPGSGKNDYSEFLEQCKMRGVKIIVDLDDDIFHLPDYHTLYQNYKKGGKQYKQARYALELADELWVSTKALADQFGKDAVLIPNAIMPHLLPKEPAPDRGLWAWRGRSIQAHDLMAHQGWYKKIRNKAKQWLFLGWKPPLDHADNVSVGTFLSNPMAYLQSIRSTGLNGIWKPMIDCEFNHAKSNIAWIEATMAGGVCLTNFAGRDEWKFATKNFPDYKTSCDLWQQSKQEIEKNYNLAKTGQMRASRILHLCSHRLPISHDMPTTSDAGTVQPNPGK